MSLKIALNAGHGFHTPGKRCLKSLDPKETREWYLNNRICNKIEAKLKSYSGYALIRLDDKTGETNVDLGIRTDKANNFGADIYLSIHHNAGIGGGTGGGIVAYTYTSVDDVTKDWQKEFYNAIIKKTGLKGNRSNPLAKADLHECRESKMPAVLLECGFMDSATDVPIILTDKFADEVAEACVEVLAKKGKLTKKSENVESPSTKPSASGTSKKSIDEIAKEVIAGKWGNGAERKERITKAGYDYSDVQDKVNEILTGVKPKPETPQKKSINDIAKEVIQGKWGNGADRKARLAKAGYSDSEIKEIQNKVNMLL